ncbi:MAG: ribonuclease H-like domain-containing protein [Candidatus Hydrothermarchaeales archaeon]
MDYISLDIETAPLKIEDDIVIEYLIKKKFVMGTHPLFSKIITIGIKENEKEPVFFRGDKEHSVLTGFWKRIKLDVPPKIVTFNGYNFDIPFLLVRSKVNNIEPTLNINTNKWKMDFSNHFDCMLAFSEIDKFSWVSLDIICRLMGIPVPEDRIKRSQVIECYQKKDWEPILKRNKQDLALVESLYEKIR